jgi:IS1 family transposase
MAKLTLAEIAAVNADIVTRMSRTEVDRFALQAAAMVRHLANQLAADSTNSSRPPSSDPPWRRDRDGKPAAGDGPAVAADAPTPETGAVVPRNAKPPGKKPEKPSGKRPGMPGFWRRQPIVVHEEVPHRPDACEDCHTVLGTEAPTRLVSAHNELELERGDMALQIRARKQCYYAVRCSCGHETVAAAGTGASSHIDSRKRDLLLSERCLVGPMLATFIAALSLRMRLSRAKIGEFLLDWLGLELGKATINRCIHEFGLASEPVVEELIAEVQSAGLANVDETPWYQKGQFLWMWVMVTASAVIFRIGSRGKETLVELVSEAFLGWLVTDGYMAYRDRPRRQRCLAHLIRKAIALAEGHYHNGSSFGRDMLRDLRSLIEKVAAAKPTERDAKAERAIQRLLARIKWNCQCNQHDFEEKVRAYAREILRDWDAVIAFVANPLLPATNNDAERALRHVVLARMIGFGTRTDEGSRFYAAALSVVETCRKRKADPWVYARDLIAAARKGAPHPKLPAPAAA